MNESNQDFTELKRLLKLKQHEIPPPGYFHNFSDDIIGRIRAGEAGGAQSFLEQINEQMPWLGSLLRIFETKPGVIGGFAVSLCALLLVGVLWPESRDPAPGQMAALDGSQSAQPAAPSVSELASLAPADENSGIDISPKQVNTLQPSLQALPALFGSSPNSLFQVEARTVSAASR